MLKNTVEALTSILKLIELIMTKGYGMKKNHKVIMTTNHWVSFTAAIFMCLTSSMVGASVITVSGWFANGVDDGSIDFLVTETFTSASDLGGADNRYEYSVTNLTSDLSATLFRMSNSAADPRTSMSGTDSWGERVGATNFIWETSTLTDYIDPGETRSGFFLFTNSILPPLTNPPLAYNAMGWIHALDQTGGRVDVYGDFPRDGSVDTQVPEPSILVLMGFGLAGLGFARRRKQT